MENNAGAAGSDGETRSPVGRTSLDTSKEGVTPCKEEMVMEPTPDTWMNSKKGLAEERRRREKCAIFMSIELFCPFTDDAGTRAVPAYAWSEEIITDYVAGTVQELSQVIILNQRECLLFRGKRSKGKGIPWEEAYRHGERLSGPHQWVGKDVIIRAVPITLTESKQEIANAKKFIRSQNLEKLARRHAESKKKTAPSVPATSEPVSGRGRGQVKRADKHFAKKYQEATMRERLNLLEDAPVQSRKANPASSDAGLDTSEESSDTTTYYESSDEELDSDDVVGYSTENSHYTTVADRDRRIKKARRRERKRERCYRHRGGRVNLPIFKDSKKEEAISYTDWRAAVQELLTRGMSTRKVRQLVLEALEGAPKADADAEYQDGQGSLKDILSVLDKVYGRQTSFIALQSELCNMTQQYNETAKNYYQRLSQVMVSLRKLHSGRLNSDELAKTAKESFYNGLREEYKPMVVHLKDKPNIRVSDLLQAVRVIEEDNDRGRGRRRDTGGYPPSVSTRGGYKNDQNYQQAKDKPYYWNRDNKPAGTGTPVGVHAAQMEAEPEAEQGKLIDSDDEAAIYLDGYYCSVIHQADEEDRFFGTCFNCREIGHRWRDCTKPRRPMLQKAVEKQGLDIPRLNASGGGGAKGARDPQPGARIPVPATAPVPK